MVTATKYLLFSSGSQSPFNVALCRETFVLHDDSDLLASHIYFWSSLIPEIYATRCKMMMIIIIVIIYILCGKLTIFKCAHGTQTDNVLVCQNVCSDSE